MIGSALRNSPVLLPHLSPHLLSGPLALPLPRALYIHIPFCQVRCTYCAFNIYTRRAQTMSAYVQALAAELRWLASSARNAGMRIALDTIYIGGGTPSLLRAAQIADLLADCRAAFSVADDAEITLEVNPDDARDAVYFAAVRAAGVNRLSIGMQSAHPEELRRFARQHRQDAVIATVQAARQAGQQNISLDLIYGAPLQTLDTWQQTLDAALTLQPDHLSLYALQIEPDTTLQRQIAQGGLPMPDDDLAADMYDLATTTLTTTTLAQYEISTWAKAGHECRHNLQYWHNQPFIGIGAGAYGSSGAGRYRVTADLDRYITRAGAQPTALTFPLTAAVESWEPITPDQAMDETVMTELRLTRSGLDRRAFIERFGQPVEVVYADAFARVAPFDALDIRPDRIVLRPAARLISNQVLLHFMRNPG